jgi:transcriptional regulator with XRE-family HTH domain
MPESFGARLRQRREERGLDLVTIAERTKIKRSLLDELEQGNVSHWPSGFYRRAFIRAYAQALGLDADAVVREFQEVHPEPVEVDVIAAMASTLDRGEARPTAAIRNAVSSALASLSRLRGGTSSDEGVATDGASSNAVTAAPPELPVVPPPSSDPDLMAVARLCTDFGRAGDATEVQPLLKEAAKLLDATGLIVWLWDASSAHLKPVLVHGYSDRVVAQLPEVSSDADNATAAAFRTNEMCTIGDSAHGRGALVVPLLTPAGCMGVLAIELQRGTEQTKSVRAVATILAAQLAQLTGGAAPAEVSSYGTLPCDSTSRRAR